MAAKKKNAAQVLFERFFLGPITYASNKARPKHVRHQGTQECNRRLCQFEMGICGL
jgi:hypothetical protein